MMRRLDNRYPKPGGMFALSFGLHLLIVLLILKGPFLRTFHPEEPPAIYVDMATLPVANPQSGTPAPSTGSAAAPSRPAPPPPAAPRKPEMAVPATKPKVTGKAALPKPEKKLSPTADESRAYNERMAKLERQAEDKRQADVLNRLRRGAAGRTGMPGAKGTQAGSDYTSYLRSRIQDAINALGAPSRSKSLVVMVTITIGADGRIADYHIDKKSGDQSFDDAVHRAVMLAGKSLKPPPEGGQYKHGFSFTPEEVVVR